MIRTMGVALRSLDRGPIAHPRPDRIYPSFADFQSVSGSKISNIYSRELFAFTEISQGAKRGLNALFTLPWYYYDLDPTQEPYPEAA